MALERKQHFVEELKKQLGRVVSDARQAEVGAAEIAESVRAEARSREDAKSALDSGRMASAHRERRERAKKEIETLIAFANKGLQAFPANGKVGLGALVDVHIENLDAKDPDEASEERTLFLLPVGAGSELEGPGGDGFISVITPASPVGRALMGAQVEDSFEITIGGVLREWSVVDIG